MENQVRHIGIIMDGNGRYGVRLGKPRTYGHKKGAANVETIIEHAKQIGLQTLTLYAFSTENWGRVGWEIKVLMYLFRQYSEKKVAAMVEADISVRFIGRRDRLDAKLLGAMQNMEAKTAGCGGMLLMIAIDYGGRDEIVRAVNKLRGNSHEITERDFAEALDTVGTPNIDLIIRTGGNQRLSNFLPWQSVYAEIVFTQTLFPEFTTGEFDALVEHYGKVERRFGGMTAAAL